LWGAVDTGYTSGRAIVLDDGIDDVHGRPHALVTELDGRAHPLIAWTIRRIWRRFDLKPHGSCGSEASSTAGWGCGC
jgi:hypothetical protein